MHSLSHPAAIIFIFTDWSLVMLMTKVLNEMFWVEVDDHHDGQLEFFFDEITSHTQ